MMNHFGRFSFFTKIPSGISMGNFPNHLAISLRRLYNIMHGVSETAERFSDPLSYRYDRKEG